MQSTTCPAPSQSSRRNLKHIGNGSHRQTRHFLKAQQRIESKSRFNTLDHFHGVVGWHTEHIAALAHGADPFTPFGVCGNKVVRHFHIIPMNSHSVQIQVPIGITILSWISLTAGCAAMPAERPQATVNGPNLRMMTYNVNFGGAGMELALAAIAEADADLVCLQETTPAWEQELRGALAGIYPRMEFRHTGGAGE